MSVLPPAPDAGGTSGKCLRLTRSRPTGDEVYGNQAYPKSRAGACNTVKPLLKITNQMSQSLRYFSRPSVSNHLTTDRLYWYGFIPVEEDHVRSYMWYSLAAVQGFERGKIDVKDRLLSE